MYQLTLILFIWTLPAYASICERHLLPIREDLYHEVQALNDYWAGHATRELRLSEDFEERRPAAGFIYYRSTTEEIRFSAIRIMTKIGNPLLRQWYLRVGAAHEMGHHLQNLAGVLSSRGQDLLRTATDLTLQQEENELFFRRELQADCLAGMYFRHQRLTYTDVQQAKTIMMMGGSGTGDSVAAATVHAQKIYGTSIQRVRWFVRGLQSRGPSDCNTFAVDLRWL